MTGSEVQRPVGAAAEFLPHQTYTLPEFSPDLLNDPLDTGLHWDRPKNVAKPAPVEPALRYYITPELWNSFTKEQVNAQMVRLKETGRWHLPNGGAEFTMRIFWGTGEEDDGDPSAITAAQAHSVLDFDMRGDKVVRVTHVVRRQYHGLSPAQKQEYLRYVPTLNPRGYNEASRILWWEQGGWLCDRAEFVGYELSACTNYAQKVLNVLIIILQDRSVHQALVEPREPSEKWKRLGLASPNNAREITMYCPCRVYAGEHGGTHASPRMHYRAEHTRMQAHGTGYTLRKVITVGAMWVNAADVDPSELGTPIKAYKLVGSQP